MSECFCVNLYRGNAQVEMMLWLSCLSSLGHQKLMHFHMRCLYIDREEGAALRCCDSGVVLMPVRIPKANQLIKPQPMTLELMSSLACSETKLWS